MIYLVDSQSRELFESQLTQMHRLRKRVFVDQLGWCLPTLHEQERDAFDHAHTLYLLSFGSPASSLAASARLIPTLQPTLMSALFGELCADGVPSQASVWEASRFCAHPSLSRRERLGHLWQIFAALLETSFLYGIERLIFTANRRLLPLALNCGWDARVLGPTLPDGTDDVTAVEVVVTQAALRRLRLRFCIQTPIIRVVEPRWREAA